jgi:hypothetical protein
LGRIPGTFNYRDPENIKKVKLIFDNRDAYYDIEEMLAFSDRYEKEIIAQKINNLIKRDDHLMNFVELTRKGTKSMTVRKLKELYDSLDN